jgi:hypothetical protein
VLAIWFSANVFVMEIAEKRQFQRQKLITVLLFTPGFKMKPEVIIVRPLRVVNPMPDGWVFTEG